MKYDHIYEKILDARDVLKDIKHVTRLDHSSTFSRFADGEIYLKLENLQKTGSFKVRGAAYAMSQLTDNEKEAGVVAASAGNHAQGVAYAATRLGIKSTIVMPVFSPVAKIQATEGYGAEVILHGTSFDDALSHALEIADNSDVTFLHPFNDEDVIAGQGTIGLEILDELPDVETIAVPVGGGGLVSGIAIAIKHQKPDVKIYGVEAKSADAMKESLAAGKVVGVEGLDTICDGIAVKKPGSITFEIASDLLEGVVSVEEFQVTRTLFHLLERAKIVVEPAGTVGLAAMQHGVIDVIGKKAVAVLSGGNIDMSMMSRLVEKELFRLGRSVRVKGVILDRIGSMNKVLEVVAESGVSVIQISQDRSDPDIAPNKAELELVLEVPDQSAVDSMLKLLREKGMEFEIHED
ncbi:MAG: L-threonine ammonia-lyase [Candidatus Thorarchaeota archaeon]|nr:MAG: L-threonine ammonia-lyase [Candidatus Thorarchaeota archaeon]